jgi:hypothetical protein
MQLERVRRVRPARLIEENQWMDAEEIIDRLYSLPLSEFTSARNEAERELRRAGETEQAARVKALRKPTAAAAAVNSLVRAHRAEVDAFLGAAAKLRDAQFAGKGDLAAASQAEREALEALVSMGGEAVRPTLQAAAVDDNTARELLEARLVREPEPAGFGTLLTHSNTQAMGRGKAKQRAAKTARPDDEAARKRLQEAELAHTAAVADEEQAQRRWTQTRRDLETAQAAVDKARRDLDRLHGR